jgi:hypothetical protein
MPFAQRLGKITYQIPDLSIIFQVNRRSSDVPVVQAYRGLTDSQNMSYINLLEPIVGHEFFGNHCPNNGKDAFYGNLTRDGHSQCFRMCIV